MTQRLTRDEFRRWAEGQTRRYERIAGEPVAMPPEPAMHVRLKSRVCARSTARSGKPAWNVRRWLTE
jgi:Uma2 family endonuclease